jgi:acyl transferase domain-containing protein
VIDPNMISGNPAAMSVQEWLVRRIATLRGLDVGSVHPEQRFTRYGLDSLTVTQLLGDLSRHLGTPVAPTAAWAHPTPAALASHLAGGASPAREQRAVAPSRAAEPVAIVGLACRLPGADSPDELWTLLTEGRDAVRDVPPERWPVDEWYDPDPARAGKIATRRGGFLRGIDGFDPRFFGISPAEARHMDPQQRLMLELAWEALADAGLPPSSLRGRSVGVFVGAMWTEYAALMGSVPGQMGPFSATGGDLSIIPARISYTLGLTGPSITVNTACSSSLVALHQARRSLAAGECDLALAGGVNLMSTPAGSVAMSRFGAMAPDGRCKAFDDRADGYVRSEGGGLVVLKPLSAARADGDPFYCTVIGSAVNNDGFSNGLAAPSPFAQEAVIRAACADAGVDPVDVDFVETHGTGTRLGDPIEAGALGAVYGAGRPADEPLLLGAVKTNLGHLEAAAGVAGLIKTALAMRHRQIPGNLHFRQPSQHIPFDQLRLEVPTAPRPWPERGPALAGVSSFGFGGTNCHVLLAAPAPSETPRLQGSERGGSPAPVFVFGGQGSQWVGAGRELMAEPVFARVVRDCDRAMAPYLSGSVVAALTQSDDWVHDTEWVQPVVFTVQVALAALWESWGVRPAAVVGSSMGEVAAAYVSGALGLDDAARVICLRSRLVGQTEGGMVVVELGAEELRAEPGVHIAVLSSPGRTAVSGAADDLDRARAAWERQGVTVRRIDIDYASHSPLMDPLLPLLREQLAGLLPGPTHIPFWSTVTAGPLPGTELGADYWCRNLREPVRFAPTVTRLADDGAALFLDVNPHPVALRDLKDCVPHGQVLPSLRRGEPEVLLESAAALGLSTAAAPAQTLLPVSAHTEPALRAAAAAMADRLRGADSAELARVCHTAAVHRDHHEFRLAVVAERPEEYVAALDAVARDEPAPAVVRGRAPVPARAVFVFPGQGGQFPDMGIDLYREEPVFRRTAYRCAQLIHGESGIDLLPWLEGKPLPEDAGIDTIQPALFTIGVALAALWRSWGVEPVAVVGHSMGEAAAAHVCGALSLPDAVRVICRRSAVYARLAGRGAMALVELTYQQALAAIGDGGVLEVAALNGSRSTVLTGEPDAIDAVIESVRATGALARRIPVDAAAHSRQVEPLLDGFRRGLAGVEPRPAAIPFISTVTGAEHPGLFLDAAYWARNLREPVRFTDAIAHLRAGERVCFLELGPHPVLAPVIEELAVAALHRDKADRRALTEALAVLYAGGAELDWQRLPLPVAHRTSLPAYPWQRERYWITDEPPTADSAPEPSNLAERLRQAPDDAAEDVRRYLTAQLAALLGLPSDDVPPDTALAELGATSLMAMELRNLLHAECGVEVLVSQVLQSSGLGALSQTVAQLASQSTMDTLDEDEEILL